MNPYELPHRLLEPLQQGTSSFPGSWDAVFSINGPVIRATTVASDLTAHSKLIRVDCFHTTHDAFPAFVLTVYVSRTSSELRCVTFHDRATGKTVAEAADLTRISEQAIRTLEILTIGSGGTVARASYNEETGDCCVCGKRDVKLYSIPVTDSCGDFWKAPGVFCSLECAVYYDRFLQ